MNQQVTLPRSFFQKQTRLSGFPTNQEKSIMATRNTVVSFVAGDTVRVRPLFLEAWDRANDLPERKSNNLMMVVESATDAISETKVLHLTDVKGNRFTALAQFLQHHTEAKVDVRDKFTGQLIAQFDGLDAASKFVASMHYLNAQDVWVRQHVNGKENGYYVF
jgi:hypothetical protein